MQFAYCHNVELMCMCDGDLEHEKDNAYGWQLNNYVITNYKPRHFRKLYKNSKNSKTGAQVAMVAHFTAKHGFATSFLTKWS